MKHSIAISIPILALCSTLGCGAPSNEAGSAEPASPTLATVTPSVPGARVYIVSPAGGAVVTSPVRVVFGLRGMGVAPAGVQKEGTGHHHLIIDGELPALDEPLPADATHLHFGGGQTEVELDLEPGEHTLQLVLANHLHIPHDPPVYSQRISITVR